MKVGTDAVLLGAWVNVEGVKSILEVGTGCGVIALMLAQRSEAVIDAIDIDGDSIEQAKKNIVNSPWSSRIKTHHTSLQDFKSADTYDLIVSNPPFFSNSLLPPAQSRKAARHTETLSFDDLLNVGSARLAVILPVAEGGRCIEKARSKNLFLQRSLAFFSRQGKPQERWLLEFSRSEIVSYPQNLTLYKEGDIWTEEYSRLTADFYL